MLVLVLESSTNAAKALLYHSENGILEDVSFPYSSDISKAGKQDTEGIFLATLEAGRSIAAGKEIAAITVSGVWHSLAICDQNMIPTSPTYTWTFTGASDICRKVRSDKKQTNHFYSLTGCMPNITYQPYTLRYLVENGMYLEDKLLSSQAGYSFYRLTGERVETACIISGMGLLNTHSLTFDKDILDFAGVKESQFGRLGTYKTTYPLNRECADILGIAPGIPVVVPHSDGALNQVGNGAFCSDTMTLSVGTSAAVRVVADRPVLSDPPGTWCYVGAEGWISGAATAGACNCIDWFKKTVLNDKWSFDHLEKTMLDDDKTPVFLPFLFGERCPGWLDDRRGGFEDLDADTTVPQMFKAICEGVLFNIYQCYDILIRYNGKPNRIIMSGGIINSAAWSQLAADVFACDITLSNTAQASMLGGAALALHAAGKLSSLSDFPDYSGDIISPRKGSIEHYKEKYEKYLEYYNRH